MKRRRIREKNPLVEQIVDRLWAAFSAKLRGETIHWEELEEAGGFSRHQSFIEGVQPMGRYIVLRFIARLLRERDIATKVSWNLGIRLLTNQETAVELPYDRQKRAYRQVNKCLREMATVNAAELTFHERLLHTRQVQNLRNERLLLGRSKREAKQPAALFARSQTVPAIASIH